MKKFISLFFIITVFFYVAKAQVITDFEGGTRDGWVSEGDGVSYWESGTGNPGGCMRVDDDATGNWNNAYAPVKFLGDWSGVTASDYVMADIFLHKINGSNGAGTYVFHIKGPGGEARALTGTIPPLDVWTTYTANFNPANWTIISGTWNAILASVTEFVVRAEYINGDEYNRLDNIILSITPAHPVINPVICSDFESGLFEGWSFESTGGVTIPTSGGNPGRYVSVNDGSGISTAIIPSNYLGDWSGLDNHTAEIQVDYKITNINGPLISPANWVRISGPGGAANYYSGSDMQYAFNQWHSFGIPIEESLWTMESGTWDAMLDYVSEVRLIVEFISGTETVGFDNFCISNLPPVSDFAADHVFIFQGDEVKFTDKAKQAPVTWAWDFGDSGTSTDVNPVHTYNSSGTYSVELTTTNFYGSDSELKTSYIEVYPIDQCLKWEDNFNDNSIHPGWQFRNGTWTETSGQLRQTSNYYGSGILDGCYALTGSYFWSDYSLSTDFYSTDDDVIGLVINYQNATNMYMFTWNKQVPGRKISKWINGVETVLASEAVAFTQNTWYHADFGTQGGHIWLDINGINIFDINDNSLNSGKAALFCYANQSSYYDNVEVRCANELDLKVFLQGPFNGAVMNTSLNPALIPLNQPFQPALPYFGTITPDWYYTGTESITAIPDPDIVDWVYYELRDAASAALATKATAIASGAAFLLNDGHIVGLDGTRGPLVSPIFTNNLYAAVWHRNHLGVLSANPLSLSGGVYSYDFTTAATQVYGGATGHKQIASGVWGLTSGDGNGDGLVSNTDKNNVWRIQVGSSGYLAADFNLNGQVDNSDKTIKWMPNSGSGSQVPD